MAELSKDQLRQLCEALGWQGGTFWQALEEAKRLSALADAEGSRAVMLVRHRRELIDLGRAVADKIHAATEATNDKAVRYLIGEADALAVKFFQHLPNSPEDTPAGVAEVRHQTEAPADADDAGIGHE